MSVQNITSILKRFGWFLAAFLITLTSVMSLSAQHVLAEPVSVDLGDVDTLVENQYKARVAMRVMFDDTDNCFIGRNEIGKEWKSEFNKNDDDNGDNLSGPWDANSEVGEVGSLFKGGGVADGKNHEIDCNTAEDMQPVFAALGYSGVGKFIEAVYNCSDASNPDACTLRKNPRDIVLKHVKEEKLGGNGGNLSGDFTDPIRYWYWNTIYRKSACRGILTNSNTRFAEEDSNHGKDLGSDRRYNIGEDGTLTGYQYIVLNGQALDHSVEGLAATARNEMNGNTTCSKIADQLTGTRAGAYLREFLIPQLSAAVSPEIAAKCGTTGADVNVIIQCYIDNEVSIIAPPEDSLTGDDTSCEAQSGVTGWLVCPALSLVGGALNWVDTQLSRLLEVDRDKYTNSEMYTAWSQFRNIGLTLLIAAMLVMVISTALGIGALDAYTVKKAFPRMVAAVIFMLLSWYVCIFLIDASNVVGKGTLGLMTSPFGTKAQSLTSLFDPSTGGAIAQYIGIGSVGAVFAGTTVGGAAASILLNFLAAGLLVLLAAFFVLIARQLFIIVLVLLAPVAILSWIFPGNDKLWKFWWQSFSKLLLMFPIIMALIAAGRIFAGVLAESPGGGAEGGLLNPILKLVAYILPYAFIPFTFKAAGGAFGNIAGMVNDRSRGAFDRLKKGRQKSMGQIGESLKGGDFLRGATEGNRRQRFNQRTAGLGTGFKGNFGFGEKGQEAVVAAAGARADAAANDAIMKRLINGNDDATMLLGLSGGSAAGAKTARDDLLRHWREDAITKNGGRPLSRVQEEELSQRASRAFNAASAVGFTRANAEAALNGAMGNKARAISSGGFDVIQAGVERLAGGNESYAQQLAYGAQYNARGAGRTDLGGDWTNPDLAGMTHDQRKAAVFWDAVKKGGVQGLTAGHGAGTVQAREQIVADLKSGDVARAKRGGALLTELHGQLASATGENRNNILATFEELGIPLDGSETFQSTSSQTLPNGTSVPITTTQPKTVSMMVADRIINSTPITMTEEQLSYQISQEARTYAQGTDPRLVTSTPGAPAAGGPTPPAPSDRRLKRSIVQLGVTGEGINIYRFKYLWSDTEYVGVMAQEVLNINPAAVSVGVHGYYRVDYSLLGLKMQTYSEWLKQANQVTT